MTDHGIVYILGIIEKGQEENMLRVARGVDGVKRVVPLVQYKNSDSKLNLPSSN